MMQKVLSFLSYYYLNLVFYISLLAALGSLVLSNVLYFPPCELCWFQRVFIYPIPIIAGIAMYSGEKGSIAKYMLGLSIPGAVIAAYHYAIQMNIIQNIIPGCNISNPCTDIQIQWLGFITIPLLSFGAFVVISLLVGNYLYRSKKQ